MAHSPYKAQLGKFLDEHPAQPFSAHLLRERFDNGGRTERDALNAINAELKRAFADGRIVQYRDDEGATLTDGARPRKGRRERDCVLYGLASAPAPDGAQIVNQQDATPGTANGSAPAASGDQAPVPPPSGEDEIPTVAADGVDQRAGDLDVTPQDADASPTGLSEREARARVKAFPAPGDTAPEWVDERVLREWASLPTVCRRVVSGLDSAVGPDKYALIRAGVVNRKQRTWRTESTIAGNLARLCRTSSVLWQNVAEAAIEHYLTEHDGLAEDLAALAANPIDYYTETDSPPDAVLLCVMALGVEDGTLDEIAADCATVLGELKIAEQATAQQERIQALEAEAAVLRRDTKQADKERRAAEKRLQTLTDELEALRDAQMKDGSAADAARDAETQRLRERAERAETQLEELRADVGDVGELQAQLEGLQDAREHLEEAQALLHGEQRLRLQAEADAARHVARVRELTDQLSRVTGDRGLPVDDAAALVDALSRPIGTAARHAAERLASGRARPHDNLVLELASALSRMTGTLDVTDAAGALAAETAAADTSGAAPQLTPPAVVAPGQPAPQLAAGGGASPIAPQDVTDTGQTPPVDTPTTGTPLPSDTTSRRRRRSRIKVRALGGAGEVGGSAILVTNNAGHTVLLDCGQRVRGEYGLDTEPQFHRPTGGLVDRLHGILISHAHIDHVGSLPVFHQQQSGLQDQPIPVYMTAPTRALADIMLQDSAKIQQYRQVSEAERGYLDYAAGTMEAAYRLTDVARVLDDEFTREVGVGLTVPIPDTSFVARFLPVAHVLGSCAIHLTDLDNDQTLLYTGDLGPFADPQVTLPHYSLGDMIGAQVVLMESTYGSPPRNEDPARRTRRALSGRERALKRLCDLAEHAHDHSGVLLLPSFSLGRTQELAMLLSQAIQAGEAPDGKIIVGGMGEKITEVYSSYSRGTNPWARAENMPRVDELGRRLRGNRDMTFADVCDELLAEGFSYIIASPAMLGSGWSRTLLERMIDDPRHAIAMTGYVPAHSGGIPRMHTLSRGQTITLGSRTVRIEAQFERLQGLSAHAPSTDLRDFARFMTRGGEHVAFGMLHGEPAAQTALAEDVDALPNASAQSLQIGMVWQPSRP